MKQWLTQYLVCPQCLPEELSLELSADRQEDEEILAGSLSCKACGSSYPIEDGLAVVLPEESRGILSVESGYNSKNMLSSYLWSHFCDTFDDPDATGAYARWSECFKGGSGMALDIGSSVGRLSFEMSQTHDRVIGIDTSPVFIRAARNLLMNKRLEFDMVIEGEITQKRAIEFHNGWQYDRVEFLVADAMALPFKNALFSTVASINILEKVPDPMKHFIEINRMMAASCARFVFSDPFSWDESVSLPDTWLSGRTEGKYKGFGIDNITRIMRGDGGIIDPPLTIADKKDVAWKIRKTRNLWEHITSQMILGTRE